MPNPFYVSITLHVLFLYLFKTILEKTGSISRYRGIKGGSSISRAVIFSVGENCMIYLLVDIVFTVDYFHDKIIDIFLLCK